MWWLWLWWWWWWWWWRWSWLTCLSSIRWCTISSSGSPVPATARFKESHPQSPFAILPHIISHLRWVENCVLLPMRPKKNLPIIRWTIARLWLFIYWLRSWDFSLKHFVRIRHVLARSSAMQNNKRKLKDTSIAIIWSRTCQGRRSKKQQITDIKST